MNFDEPNALGESGADTDSNAITITRRDGWTPFARRLFLEVLAEDGRVSRACEYARMTKQSAYALRAREPAFAAGWDAACELARTPLADALYEKAIDGVTDTITKDGEVVAERHRFDSRLSIAVLHRLDKRCDRAAELGSHHLSLVRHWDEWLSLVGKGEDQAAQALLESSRHGQLGQFPEGENPTDDEEDEGIDLSDRYWQSDEIFGELMWMTDFPPPAGFDGYKKREWGDPDYERECTPEEVAAIELGANAARDDALAEDEALRDAWFAMLREEAENDGEAESVPATIEESATGG